MVIQINDYIFKRACLLLEYDNASLLITTHRISRGKLEKIKAALSQDEASLHAIDSFISSEDIHALFISAPSTESLHFTTSVSEFEKVKRKIVVAYRSNPHVKISVENFKECIIFAEMTKSVLNDFRSLCEAVYGGVLSGDSSKGSSMQQKLHSFVSALSLTSGLVHGRTVLPLPPALPSSSESVLGDPGIKDLIHNLEEYVVIWSRQIRSVLAQQPESIHDWDEFPQPKAEIDFWTRRATDLNSIQSQLSGPELCSCIAFLEKYNSQYPGPFKKLVHDIDAAAEEAQENAKFVSTLTPLVGKLSSDSIDFENQIESLFEPILHYILLIWKHSRFYKGPSRLVIILRLVCNSIIKQCHRFVNGPEIFSLINNDETNQALVKINRVMQVCTTFQEKYELFKGISEQQGSSSAGGWRVQSRAVFEIFDEFRDRVKDIHNFLKTVTQYFRMEKIEIGGTRGTFLTNDLQRIVTSEFRLHVLTKFQNVEYDILQLDQMSRQKFDMDYFEFKRSVRDLDKRICFIIAKTLDDLKHVPLGIRLVDSFDGIWDRPLFAEEFEKSFKKLSDWYRSDLKKIHSLFLEQRSLVVAGASPSDPTSLTSPLGLTLPPKSRAIYWAKTLTGRANESLSKLEMYAKNFPPSVQVAEEFRNEVLKFNQSLNSTLDEFIEQIYVLWETECMQELSEKLGEKILVRQPSGELQLNFHPFILSSVIREVKYMEWFGFTVPVLCKQVYERRQFFRKCCGEITDKIVSKYNNVIGGLLDVERPLLHDRLMSIDNLVRPGLSEIDWTDETRIVEFLVKVSAAIGDVAKIFAVLRDSMRKIGSVLEKWSLIPILEKRNKPSTVDEFDSLHKASVGARMVQITDDGKDIYKWVREANEAVRTSRQSVYWRSYLEFLNVLVSEGFTRVVDQNMAALVKQLEGGSGHREDTSPILEISLRLDVEDEGAIVWDPPFRGGENDTILSVWTVMNNVIGDSFSVSSWMSRFPMFSNSSSGATGEDFVCEVSKRDDLRGYVNILGDLIDDTEKRCESARSMFDKYENLWESSDAADETEMGMVLDFPNFVDPQNGLKWMEIMTMVGLDCARIRIIDVTEVSRKLEELSLMRTEISNIKGSLDIEWIRVNSVSVKHELIELINEREHGLIACLQAKLNELVSTVDQFMVRVSGGFGKSVDGVEESLYTVMTDIKDVRLSSDALRLMIDPIKDIIGLLKRLGQSVADEALLFVEHFNGRWDGILKTALNEREKILPFQNREMEKIKARISAFSDQVNAYRLEFAKGNPFDASMSVEDAMETINGFESRTTEMLLRAKELNNLELLFDLTVSKYPELQQCVDESLLLRQVWGEVGEITGKFFEWEEILWDEMDADELIINVRDIGNKLKSQIPKEIKSWGVYTNLTATVKNMSTVLPLISDLHTDTMRDRHWRSLMDLVGVSFVYNGSEFCLGILLKLQLHRFADDVGEIVNQSAKEFKIEKKLGMMRNHWEKTIVELDICSRDDKLALLPNLGEIIEVLENHSLEMLGIVSAGGKYIEFCKPLVDEWVGKLRTIDSVLAIWQKVQRNWMRLEPIFLGSEDIRAQLAEDTRRFEQVDKEWRDLMNAVALNGTGVGVVEMCCQRDERLESLNRMHGSIEQCEKSLNDYLEEKRKIFPRFYFVSNQALLDILSNGNRPRKVAQYLGDCFDGIKDLDFVKEDESGRRVSGMFSKDGEYVAFHDELVLDGPVEQYLLKLESHMRNQLRSILESAKSTADNWDIDKPREVWLRDYCAQLALVATQIVWTEEVARAFEEIESGSETAMKEYKKICDDRIEKLIRQVQQPLSADLRNKIITIITIDVHARDVVEKFVQLKLNEASAFQWQSQLKFSWGSLPETTSGTTSLVSWTPPDQKTCMIKICDWASVYGYEYIGNCGRLVITPLTDRCYLTLTQALNLAMGAAPSGPAGTGKTETTKDLSRAIGLPIVVFNCSDQMTYMTMANVIRGLSSMGAWGCFDEFNRISLEVLSVVSTQVKSVLDAIKQDAEKFLFMDEECRLVKTVGFFITMNPGYAGRNVLPESLSSQFRSCAMVVPDLTFICENMLLSEGFLMSRQLARKFVCLYSLCKELLSAQMHYDWGLRAVKSLLRQAGSLKRADPDMDEYSILMRALRDFNTPKIVSEDLPIFLRLISDLFPGISAEPKNSIDMEQVVIQVTKERGLQPDKQFVTKVIGLLDILRVRHCCFIIGPPGSGKTTVWKILMDALKAMGEDGQYETLNPKAITSDELYGIMTRTKEWKDGAISVIMRNMSKEINGYKSSHKHKWIVLDGDIDARWIESMNTVMDDNKVLTLVSNERIPFTPSMRMLLEVQDMVHASPATVSRGGVLFINEYDIGWKPFLESWRESKFPDNQVAQSTFFLLFNQYFETHIEYIRKNFAFTCPVNDMGFVQSICSFIDALLLTKESVDSSRRFQSVDQSKCLYEAFFVYGFMWSVGGAVAEDKSINHRRNFSNWLRSITACKFPEGGEVFDYRFDPSSMSWVHWEQSVRPYVPPSNIGKDGGILYQKIIVPNTEIERLKFNLQLNMSVGKPMLFCGVAGTGKTTIVRDYLSSGLNPDTHISAGINLNSYTDSFSLQKLLEGYLDKRTGRTFGPPGNKKCIYFIDDLNMPLVDEYDTQSAAMLLFQLMSHKSIFDRAKLDERKEIVDIQFVSCMNPKAGSFMINSRLQRYYTVQSTYSPSAETIGQIFGQILGSHLAKFESITANLSSSLIQGTVDILNSLCSSPQFLPSGRKFHYQFNLKEVSNIVQGLLNTSPAVYRGGSNGSLRLARVWIHECSRVFSDRLVDKTDQIEMDMLLRESVRNNLPSFAVDDVVAKDLIMTSFVSVHGGNDKQYIQIKDMGSLRKIVEEKLVEYNETFPEMNLVLFDDATEHVCRIARIVDTPCGHALLVGVGGSGKQSLARLACFIMGVDVLTIQVNQGYGVNEFKTDLQEFIRKAAVKPGTPQALLLTDGQIVDERFLVYINDILSEGLVPGLFAKDEMDGLINGIRTAAKSVGIPDDRDALYEYLRDKVRRNLHVIICHSPVGETLRIRARKFPALIANTTVDVFHAWPRDALYNVANRLLTKQASSEPELFGSEDSIIERLSNAMADIHISIDDANLKYLATEGRYNYTTPKSFLELLSFYISLLRSRRVENQGNIERLEKGLNIMAEVEEKVSKLQEDLRVKMIEVEEKKKAANELIAQVTAASEVASAEKAIADEEAAKTNVLAQQASEIKAKADAELEEAMPAMQAAKEAVNCLTKPAIQELKSLGKPPVECTEVTKAVLILLKNERKNLDWKSAQKMMNNPQQFLDEVVAFNADSIPDWVLDMLNPILSKPFFNYETMKGKSTAAAYLTNWVVNIIGYNRIYKKVAPLMARVKEATAAKETAEAQLAVVMARVAEIEAKVASLQKTLNEAIAEKDQVEREAASCESKLSLAKRLVDGLSDENGRWSNMVEFLRQKGNSLVSDLLIAAAFVVYISPFSSKIRDDVWRRVWSPYRRLVAGDSSPAASGPDPLGIIASEADIATWRNEGLPADRMSIENASIITSCDRWPLLIDPQLQGLNWLKKRIPDLVVIQFNQPNWLQKLCTCIQNGGKILIESIGQEIDPLLDPLLSRSIIRRGRSAFVIRIGGEEIEYDMKFRMFLQCKLSNPHFKPEIAAQCTIVNFIVTPDGLEDQILAMVVNVERPELEQEKVSLVRKQNEFKVVLAQLEDDLLSQLSRADPATILDSTSLVEGLETTKRTAVDISQQVESAKKTESEINTMREKYRPVAQEGSALFFLIIKLASIEHMYQYSLDSFVGFLLRAIARTPSFSQVEERVTNLVLSVRMTIFKWVNRGLFEKHKLVLCGLLAFKLLERGGFIKNEQFNRRSVEYLLGGGGAGLGKSDTINPLSEWLPNEYWKNVQSLIELPGFELFAQNMEKDAPARFKDWFVDQNPEESKLPLDWKRLDGNMQKLLILKCLRPDRLSAGLTAWVSHAVPRGSEFVNCDTSLSFFDVLESSFVDADQNTPVFFILSPGADPIKDVEKLAKKMSSANAQISIHVVAMGQGQDIVAMMKLEQAHKDGDWVVLQNIHLMPKWCMELERKLDQFVAESSGHPAFRIFLSADPSRGIPIGILERSIKLTNEPPQGMVANMKRAFASFPREVFEEKDSKVKQILMGLCHFHSVMLERKKFGPLGYNMNYPFSIGDLRDSSLILFNTLENGNSTKIPWDDIKFLFGEIMYGGHIVDDWDRRLCRAYLDFYMTDDLVEGEMNMVPYGVTGTAMVRNPALGGPYDGFLEYIETVVENPVVFGLHPNAEIGFRTSQSSSILSMLNRLVDRPSSAYDSDHSESANSSSILSGSDKAKKLASDLLEEVASIKYNVEEVSKGLSDEEKGPYQYVFLQECECMNVLVRVMVKSLSELQLGLKGELTMSEQMEQLMDCLIYEQIPPRWTKVSFASNRPLLSWLVNLKERCAQLDDWISDPSSIPKVVDLSKLFNPQSFLNAIKQTACQRQNCELDKLQVITEVTKKTDKSQVDSHSRDGALVTGLYLEGARWDLNNGCLEESRSKEMFCKMPIINCKAGVVDENSAANMKSTYICPAYCTTKRRPNYVFSAQLRTPKHPPSKWTLAGVALILDIGQ